MTAAAPRDPVLRAERASFTFAGRSTPTIRDVDLAIEPGEIVVVAGRTGSGKSTLLRLLSGLIPRHTSGAMQGRVWVVGVDTRAARPAELAARAALVLQSPDDQLCTSTVEAEVAFGLENLAVAPDEIGRRIADALARFDLAHKRRESVQRLSGGEKQRLLLAAVWALRPRVVLLDEPFAQLDPVGAATLADELVRLRAEGIAVVVAEHRLDRLLEIADKTFVVGAGTVAAVTPSSLRDAPQLARQLPQRSKTSSIPLDRGSPLLRVDRLAFRHATASDDVWRDVSFDLYAGERVAIVGANGSGKSTLLAALAGLLHARCGAVALDPQRERVGVSVLVPQRPDDALFSKSVRTELEFGPLQQGLSRAQCVERAACVVAPFDLAGVLDEAPFALSVGQRLRVAVAAAAAMRPTLLMLDEPTTGQDSHQAAALMAALDAAATADGACVLFSTHDLALARAWADRVIVLGEQRVLADGGPEKLLRDDALLARAGLAVDAPRNSAAVDRDKRAEQSAAGGASP